MAAIHINTGMNIINGMPSLSLFEIDMAKNKSKENHCYWGKCFQINAIVGI